MVEFTDIAASQVASRDAFIGGIDHTVLLSRSVESFWVYEGRLFS